jgi:hypothetical protein
MKTLPALCLLLSLCASGQQALNQEKPTVTTKTAKEDDWNTCWLQANGTAEGNHMTYDCAPTPRKEKK